MSLINKEVSDFSVQAFQNKDVYKRQVRRHRVYGNSSHIGFTFRSSRNDHTKHD